MRIFQRQLEFILIPIEKNHMFQMCSYICACGHVDKTNIFSRNKLLCAEKQCWHFQWSTDICISCCDTSVCFGLLKPSENPIVKAQLRLFYLYTYALALKFKSSPEKRNTANCAGAKMFA